MAKLTLTDIASLQSETTAIQTLNANFEAIETALENTFSRDGTTPNQLEATFDANSKRIINLPAPQASTDAARLIDVQDVFLTDLVVPALAGNGGKIMSNDENTLLWLAPASISGLGDMLKSENLAGLASVPTSRTNLGLGTAAVATVGTSGDAIGKLNTVNTWSAGQTFTGTVSTTGAFTFSGSGDVRLSTTSTVLSDDSVGFRGAPQSVKDTSTHFVLVESGKSVLHTSASAHTWTILLNSSVPYPIGTTLVLMNTGAGVVTVFPETGVTMRLAGSGTSGAKNLAQHGLATLYKAATDTWYISGAGLS